MPHFAPFVVLLFLGSFLLMGTSLLVLFYGGVRRSSLFTRLGVRQPLPFSVATHRAAPAWRVPHDGFRL